MKRGKEFGNILDECLERLLVKGETVEQCLESYPEHAAELEPLLIMAVATKKALAIQPDREFKARARYQIHSVLEKATPKKRVPVMTWQSRWAVALVSVLAVVVAGGGTVVAADNSMPDNPLYRVKLATEQVRLSLSQSDMDKAELCATLADRRVAEIDHMVDKGQSQRLEMAAQRLIMHLAMMNTLRLAEISEKKAVARLVQPPVVGEKEKAELEMVREPASALAMRRARLRILLGRFAVKHPDRLQAILDRVPDSSKPALRKAIAVSIASYQQALMNLEQQGKSR